MINARCACGEVYNVSDDKRGYGLICAKCGRIIDLASPRSSIHRFPQKKKAWILGGAAILLVGTLVYISYSVGRGVTTTVLTDPVVHLSPQETVHAAEPTAVGKHSELSLAETIHKPKREGELAQPRVLQVSQPTTSDVPLNASIIPPSLVAKPDAPHLVVSCLTGTNLAPAIDESGRGTLTVINGNKEDAVVKLVGAADPLSPRAVYRYVYIDASDQCSISKISPGSYSLLYSIGKDWNRQDGFNENEEDYRFGKTLDFDETTTGIVDGGSQTEWSNLTVTLHSVLTGTVRLQAISKQDFDTPN
jgi:hypothetical protein